MMHFAGLPVYVTPLAESRQWVFPTHRFFEWEPKDERLCRKFGIGHEGPPRPCVIQMTDPFTGKVSLHIHPDLLDCVRRLASPLDRTPGPA